MRSGLIASDKQIPVVSLQSMEAENPDVRQSGVSAFAGWLIEKFIVRG